jgi:hypothetical protein
VRGAGLVRGEGPMVAGAGLASGDGPTPAGAGGAVLGGVGDVEGVTGDAEGAVLTNTTAGAELTDGSGVAVLARSGESGVTASGGATAAGGSAAGVGVITSGPEGARGGSDVLGGGRTPSALWWVG